MSGTGNSQSLNVPFCRVVVGFLRSSFGNIKTCTSAAAAAFTTADYARFSPIYFYYTLPFFSLSAMAAATSTSGRTAAAAVLTAVHTLPEVNT